MASDVAPPVPVLARVTYVMIDAISGEVTQ